MKLEVGKFYKLPLHHNNGDKGLFLEYDKSWSASCKVGVFYNFKSQEVQKFKADSVSEWQEPRMGECWVNVYDNDPKSMHSDKKQADVCAKGFVSFKRLACVKVNWTEGEGL